MHRVIVCKIIVIEWGSSPRKILVIFVQNGAILGNTNGYSYMCLDIMPQQEG